MMNTLTITGLNKTYSNGTKAIDHISLSVENGMFGLLGPNGAGKSSLMKTIAGLQAADSGEVRFNGVDVLTDKRFIQKQLGFLPQDFGVYPKVSAYDLLNHIALLKGISDTAKRKHQVMSLLEQVNLYADRNKEVHTFSGGMRQRFGVAQALLGNPQVILVDEPTAGLDPEERNRFNLLLSALSKDIIVFLSTHLVDDVHQLCPQMAIINKGKLVASGAPAQLVKELTGKVWTRFINVQDLGIYQSRFDLISYRFTEGNLFIVVYATSQPEGFVSLPPSLEHFYFHQIKNIEQ
ncbi:ABC transporter ATP-binding protein [Niabella sp. 22666]|uniref:ABC transporter ATP-binding protein n=1 Tax=Niabella sp. 22666 TaxID=3453954 RepID=UPI003F82AAED